MQRSLFSTSFYHTGWMIHSDGLWSAKRQGITIRFVSNHKDYVATTAVRRYTITRNGRAFFCATMIYACMCLGLFIHIPLWKTMMMVTISIGSTMGTINSLLDEINLQCSKKKKTYPESFKNGNVCGCMEIFQISCRQTLIL